jgi:hypothetical protein
MPTIPGFRRSRLLPVALSVALTVACGGSGTTPGFGDGGSTSNPVGQDSGGTTTLPTGSGSGTTVLQTPDAGPTVSADGSVDDCPPSAKLIYVTGSSNQLYSYAPETATFTLIGTFDCLTNPTHMTVDRTGTAWVVANAQLYTASTANAHCTAVANWKVNLVLASDFALTFVGTTAPDNTLYILNGTGTLGSFDIQTGVGKVITSLAGLSDTQGDMTSNGDGNLYFVHDIAAQELYAITPTTGAIVNSWVTGETGGQTEALAYYGGLFYDFLNSAVYTFDPATKVATPIGTAPLDVTGAGQSTCVPSTAPPPAPISK